MTEGSESRGKVLVSGFVCLNLFTVVFCNLPEAFYHWMDQSNAQKPPIQRDAINMAVYGIRTYAHHIGLDNRWQMFGRQSRFNWHFHIYGIYSDGKTTKMQDLADPRQSQRNFWQANFVDYKEGKFHLNIYSDRVPRQAYAFYLARTQPNLDGLPITTVVFELKHQWLREPRKAQLLGDHLEPQVNVRTLDAFLIGNELKGK